MDYVDFVNDKEAFVQNVQDALYGRAFVAVQDMKKEIANDFIKQQMDEEQ